MVRPDRSPTSWPEDLGGLRSPVAQGKWVRPASIWKLPDLRQAAEKLEGMQSIALHQCNWGAPTPKPTRLLTDLLLHASFLYNQWPQLDNQGKYFSAAGLRSQPQIRAGPAAPRGALPDSSSINLPGRHGRSPGHQSGAA